MNANDDDVRKIWFLVSVPFQSSQLCDAPLSVLFLAMPGKEGLHGSQYLEMSAQHFLLLMMERFDQTLQYFLN